MRTGLRHSRISAALKKATKAFALLPNLLPKEVVTVQVVGAGGGRFRAPGLARRPGCEQAPKKQSKNPKRPTHNSHARIGGVIHHPDWMDRHSSVPAGHPQYSGARTRVGGGWLSTRPQSTSQSVPTQHGSGA